MTLRFVLRLTVRCLLGLLIVCGSVDDSSAQRGRSKKKKQRGGQQTTQKRTTQKKRSNSTAPRKDRSSQEEELARLRTEIREFEQQLAAHERKEKQAIGNLQVYNRKTAELKDRIAKLSAQAGAIASELREVSGSLRETTSSIETLKGSYEQGIQHLYKSQLLADADPPQYLIVPEDRSKASRAKHYAEVIGKEHGANYRKLDSTRVELVEVKEDLTEDLNVQRTVLGQAARERSAVEQRKAQQAKELAQIQKDRERIKKELDRRRASAKKLERMIANLIAREEAARKAEIEKKRSLANKRRKEIERTGRKPTKQEEKELRVTEDIDAAGSPFAPKSLLWPTTSRKIKQGYGEQRNAELNTVTVNLGIDIAAERGSPVYAVADGDVSLISALPNYGNLIILRHAGGFHTVYADLESIAVRQGSKVRAGQRIASTGVNVELGGLLHFEVWRGRNKQNPLAWLR